MSQGTGDITELMIRAYNYTYSKLARMLIKYLNFCTCKYETMKENIPLIAITLISGLNAYFTHTLNHFPGVIDICHII